MRTWVTVGFMAALWAVSGCATAQSPEQAMAECRDLRARYQNDRRMLGMVEQKCSRYVADPTPAAERAR